ncbi:MAG: glycine cleavage system protein GcvH [Xanthomonadales bacterium]|nr:glycine cleavage system protein GcvH [Xanthomonadales bacterium]MCF6262328.1 glycine cleavage system protein GcvH [Xanthomonadales bacterium]
MNDVPGDMFYTESHEWVKMDDEIATIGISDHAQGQLGDVVFVELPEVGDAFTAGDPCAVVESVKAASDIYAPISGEVVEVNELLENAPETINDDAYGEGWLFRIKADDPSEVDGLMSAESYVEVNSED